MIKPLIGLTGIMALASFLIWGIINNKITAPIATTQQAMQYQLLMHPRM